MGADYWFTITDRGAFPRCIRRCANTLTYVLYNTVQYTLLQHNVTQNIRFAGPDCLRMIHVHDIATDAVPLPMYLYTYTDSVCTVYTV